MRRRWLIWLLVLSGWTIIAGIIALSDSLTYALAYQPPRWTETLARAATNWLPWALLTPLVAWLARRWDLRGPRWRRYLATLLFSGLPIVFLKVTLTRLVRGITIGNEYLQISYLATHFLVYCGIIAAVYGVMYYRDAQARELRASQLEALLAQTRLQMLSMQLQPHFLFNTLNAIAELVRRRPEDAERMIAHLSHLLRESLTAGLVDRVPLSQELALLAHYLEIQRVRFGERLIASATIPDGAVQQALVPNLLLQPLVENSIKHGLAARRDAGRIEIHAARSGDRLVLEVIDDGVGFVAGDVREGIGLTNTRARLEAMYGAVATLDISSRGGGGTTVRITLPWQTATPAGGTARA